jgi:hypothetical protein
MVHVSFSYMDLQIFNIFIFIFQIWKLLKALVNYIIIPYEGIAIFYRSQEIYVLKSNSIWPKIILDNCFWIDNNALLPFHFMFSSN